MVFRASQLYSDILLQPNSDTPLTDLQLDSDTCLTGSQSDLGKSLIDLQLDSDSRLKTIVQPETNPQINQIKSDPSSLKQ